jgi:hypothetical protein
VRNPDSTDQSSKRALAPHLRSGPQASTRSLPDFTRQPQILQNDFRPRSGAIPESEPNKRLNRNISVYRPATAILPLYPPSIRAPPPSPIPGLTVIMPVGDAASPESADTRTSSLVASTIPSMPIIHRRPLPPVPKPFAVAPPVASSARGHARHRKRAPPASTDELDYREVISAFLENDNPAFHDSPCMMDRRTPYIAAPAR